MSTNDPNVQKVLDASVKQTQETQRLTEEISGKVKAIEVATDEAVGVMETATQGAVAEAKQKTNEAIAGLDSRFDQHAANMSSTDIKTPSGQTIEERLNAIPDEVDAAGTAAGKVNEHNSEVDAHPELKTAIITETTAKVTQEANRAETAADAAALNGKVFQTTADGLAAVAEGEFFSVPSTLDKEYMILYRHDAGSVATEIKRYPSRQAVDEIREVLGEMILLENLEFAILDEAGNMALGIRKDGKVLIQELELDTLTISSLKSITDEFELTERALIGYEMAIVDVHDNLVFGIRNDGSVVIPKLARNKTNLELEWGYVKSNDSDVIMIIGDSYTASHYTIKDQAYISNLSAMLDYRVMNFAISGNDALDMNHRIVHATAYFDGIKYQDRRPRYAVIATFTNDSQFRQVDKDFYLRNVERLIQSVLAAGTEPILFSEFPADRDCLMILRNLARKYSIRYIDGTRINRELGGLNKGPFHQGHPGTRTNGVFWISMLEGLLQLPRPEKAIKVFRKRPTFNMTDINDLLYLDTLDRYTKFKELSVTHYRLADTHAQYYDELDGDNVYTFVLEEDEYLDLEKNVPLNLSEYALIEVTIPHTAGGLEAVSVEVTTQATGAVYIRNVLDIATCPDGRVQGATPTQTDYLSKWDKVPGSWVNIGTTNSEIIINDNLPQHLFGDKLQILVHRTGGVNVTDVEIGYQGHQRKVDQYHYPTYKVAENNLLPVSKVGSADMVHWSVTGTPKIYEPIDRYDAPRDPSDYNTAIMEVCELTPGSKLGKAISLPGPTFNDEKSYVLRVWARYAPKAFLDNSQYNLDSNQVIDRSQSGITYATHSLINEDTANLKKLSVEYSFDTTIPSSGGCVDSGYVCLTWRPVDFIIHNPPAPLGDSNFIFDLFTEDESVQIGKIQLLECN